MPSDTVEANSGSKKRAPLVCFRCHGKKIKCNLAEAPANQPCSHCIQAKTTCQPRPSRRGLGRRQSVPNKGIAPCSGNERADDGSSSIVVADHNFQNLTPPAQRVGSNPIALSDESFLAGISDNGAGEPQSHPTIDGTLQATCFPVIPSPNSLQAHSTPGSQQSSLQTSRFGNTGYMQILSHDNIVEEDRAHGEQFPAHLIITEPISPVLQDVFIESYLEYCFVWCPVLDRDFLQNNAGAEDCSLLQHALALCGSCINPPLIQVKSPAVYYRGAKTIFYNDYKVNPLLRVASIMLFFWWSAGAPNLTNMDNAWWWTGIAIRIAQEAGLHREPQPNQQDQPWETVGLRRRIWWTLFARDRILAISQGRPAVIDPDYCDIRMISVDDFPNPSDPQAQTFVQWVKLWEISGRISKHLSRRSENRTEITHFTKDLTSWVQSLPEYFILTIHTARTTMFNRDVHRLYITYLTSVILLHLSKSPQLLPKASNTAIIAASCVARLFEDFLTRGKIQFLSGEAGWELAVAILALLHARRFEDLRQHADADIYILRTALGQMALRWPSSRMFSAAFDKLSSPENISLAPTRNPIFSVLGDQVQDTEMLDAIEDASDAMGLFPFVTDQTSPLIRVVLSRDLTMPFSGLDWPLDISANLQDFLPLEDYDFSIPNV